MNLVVFGATGRTGTEIVKQALEKGHEVTAFLREPSRMAIGHERLSTVSGDVFDPASVAQAVRGHDAVICALGAGSDLGGTTVRTTGTINIISGMQMHDVERLLAISAMGVGDSWDSLSLINKLFFAVVLRSARQDHEAQEIAIKESGLKWTIIRPSGLTDAPRTGVYEVGENIRAKTSRIARADVAELVVKEAEQNRLVGKAVTITN
jgi:putative NADH-flavin reductase